MSSNFSIRVITLPGFMDNEAERIADFLRNGVDYVHIRKPDWSITDVRKLIEDIPYQFRCRLILHGHFELLNEMNLAGVSLNSRNPIAPKNAKLVGIACHSVKEVLANKDKDFITLSPIYPSISKPGYAPKQNFLKQSSNFEGYNVIALGGVTPDKFEELKNAGFKGAAMMGAAWGKF